MPDQYGRPSFNDFMAISNAWTQSQEQSYLRQQRAKTQEYGARLTKGEPVDPNEPGFDFASFMRASSAVTSQKSTNAEADSKIREQKQAQLNDLIISGEQKLSQGDQAGFWNTMQQTYDFMPDGNKIVGFSKDYSKMVIEGPTGQRGYQPTPDPKQALQMAKGFSTKFAAIDQAARAKRIEYNSKAFGEGGDPWVDDQGNVVSHFAFLGKNMEVMEALVDPKTMEIVGGFDPKTEQYIQPQAEYRPWKHEEIKNKIADRDTDVRKAEADIQNIQSRTSLNKANEIKARTTDGTKSDEDQKKKYKADLELVLKPFAGSKAAYDEEGNLTDEGKTALEAAQKLVGKYQRKEEMSPDERTKLKHAIRAWDIYQKISEDIHGEYKSGSKASWKDIQ
jgi:hypothetical protein